MTVMVLLLAVGLTVAAVGWVVCWRRLVDVRQVAGAALVAEQTAMVAAQCAVTREQNVLRAWRGTLDTWRRLQMSGDDRFLAHFEGLWLAETPVGRAGASDGG